MTDSVKNTGVLVGTPNKQGVLDILNTDISYFDAMRDLIDNAVDNAVKNSLKTFEVDVKYQQKPKRSASLTDMVSGGAEYDDVLIIEDDTGGRKQRELAEFLQIGETGSKEHNELIGAYGVGLIRGVLKLGRHAEVRTHSESSNDSKTHGFVLGEDYRETDDWDAQRIEDTSLSPGSTEIRVYGLDFDFMEKVEEFQSRFGWVYEKFLTGEGDSEMELALKTNAPSGINLYSVTQPDPIPWSFTPFGYYPRRYPKVPINPELADLDEPVYVTITIGLVHDPARENAGTDIYINDRKVVHKNLEASGGFGKGRDWFLRAGDRHAIRTRLVLEFESGGDKSGLPWDTAKSDVQLDSPVLQEAYLKAQNFAEQYLRGHDTITNQTLPAAEFLDPYTKKCGYAYNGGEIVEYDTYENRETARVQKGDKFNSKKVEDITKDAKNIDTYALCHARMLTYIPECVRKNYPDEYVLAYKKLFETYVSKFYDVDDSEVVDDWEFVEELDERPDGLFHDEDQIGRVHDTVHRFAKADIEEGVYDTSVTSWKSHLYDYLIQEEAEEAEDAIEPESLSETELERDVNKELDDPIDVITTDNGLETDNDSDINIGSNTENDDADVYQETVRPGELNLSVKIPTSRKDALCDTLDIPVSSSQEEISEEVSRLLKNLCELYAAERPRR